MLSLAIALLLATPHTNFQTTIDHRGISRNTASDNGFHFTVKEVTVPTGFAYFTTYPINTKQLAVQNSRMACGRFSYS